MSFQIFASAIIGAAGLLVLAPAAAAPGIALQLATQMAPASAPNGIAHEQQDSAMRSAVVLQSSAAINQSIIRSLVIPKARTMLDVRYAYGSNRENAVDCSALIRQAYQTAGIALPRSSKEMFASGHAVQRQNLKAGDLLFFRWKSRQLHVAIYIDENTMVHASPKRGRVIVTQLDASWNRRMIGARRLL